MESINFLRVNHSELDGWAGKRVFIVSRIRPHSPSFQTKAWRQFIDIECLNGTSPGCNRPAEPERIVSTIDALVRFCLFRFNPTTSTPSQSIFRAKSAGTSPTGG